MCLPNLLGRFKNGCNNYSLPNLLDLKKARFSYQITESPRSLRIIRRRLIYQTNILKVKE